MIDADLTHHRCRWSMLSAHAKHNPLHSRAKEAVRHSPMQRHRRCFKMEKRRHHFQWHKRHHNLMTKSHPKLLAVGFQLRGAKLKVKMKTSRAV